MSTQYGPAPDLCACGHMKVEHEKPDFSNAFLRKCTGTGLNGMACTCDEFDNDLFRDFIRESEKPKPPVVIVETSLVRYIIKRILKWGRNDE